MTELHFAIRERNIKKSLDLIFGRTWSLRPAITFITRVSLIDTKDWNGDTPLHMVVSNYKKNHQACHTILEALLRAGANTEAINAEGCTPLHIAAANGLIEPVRLLLQAGAKVDTCVQKKYERYVETPTTALGYAAFNGHDDVIEELFKCEDKPEINGIIGSNTITPLQAAAASGKITTVQLLLDKGAKVNDIISFNIFSCRTPLWYAMDYGFKNYGDFSIAKLLLINEADPNAGRCPYVLEISAEMALDLKMRTKVDELLSEIIQEMDELDNIRASVTLDGGLNIQYGNIKLYISSHEMLHIIENDPLHTIRYKPTLDIRDLLPDSLHIPRGAALRRRTFLAENIQDAVIINTEALPQPVQRKRSSPIPS